MPKRALPHNLRFKLDMVANNHGVNIKGVTIGAIVSDILKNSNLTVDEKKILDDVCKYLECPLKGWVVDESKEKAK